MQVVKLKGAPHEMGIQYGQQCKKGIKMFTILLYFMASRMSMPDMETGQPKSWYILPALLGIMKKKAFRTLTSRHEEWVGKYYPSAIDIDAVM